MIQRAKSEAIRRGLNLYLSGKYGEITKFRLNAEEQSLHLTVLLEGEIDEIDVTVGRYELIDHPERPTIEVREVRVSRAWMHELAQENLEGQSLRIPSQLTGVVKMILT